MRTSVANGDSPATAQMLTAATLVIAGVCVGALLFQFSRHLWFFQDEWAWIVARRDWSTDALLGPHNEHWATIPVAIYKILFEVVGLTRYGPYAAIGVVAHLGTACLLFYTLRRRAGAVPAAVGALVFMTYGWADEVLLWPVNLTFSIPVGAGLCGVLLWDARPTWARVLAGAVALLIGIASGGVAMPYLLVGTLLLAINSSRRRFLAVPALLLAVYAVWYAIFRLSAAGPTRPETLDWTLIPAFIGRGLSSLTSHTLGLDYRFEAIGALLAALAIGAAAAMWRPDARRTAIASIGLLSLYGLIAFGRLPGFGIDGALAPRYLYPALPFLLMILAEVSRVALPAVHALRRPRMTRVAVVAAALCLGLIMWSNTAKIMSSGERWTERAVRIRAELSVLELLRGVVPPASASAVVDRDLFFGLTLENYFEAVDALGTRSLSIRELERQDDAHLERADALAFRLMRPGLRVQEMQTLQTTGPPIQWTSISDADPLPSPVRGCSAFAVGRADRDPALTVSLSGGSALYVRSSAQRATQLFLGLFAETHLESASTVFYMEPNSWQSIRLPELPDSVRWNVRLDPPPEPGLFEVCAAQLRP